MSQLPPKKPRQGKSTIAPARRPKGSGSVFREGASWRGILKRDGRVVARVRAPSEELAWERMRAAERGENPRLIQADVAPTLANYSDTWLKRKVGAKGERIKDNTLIGLEQKFRLHIVPYFGHELRIDQLTPKTVSEFFTHLREQGLSNSSIANTRNALSALLTAAGIEGYVQSNPARGLHVGEAGDGFNVVGFSDDLAGKIIDAMKGSWNYDAVATLLYCPMREGELLRLDWSKVYLNAKRLTVMATDTRVLAPAGSGHYAMRGVGTPKTKSGKRDVPIPPEAERLLRRRYVDMGFPKSGLVFPSERDPLNPVSPRSLLADFQARMKTAGLPVTKIHELRHIAISLLLANGADPGTVSIIAGHANANITSRFYRHVLDGKAYAAASTLSFFGPGSASDIAAKKAAKRPQNGLVSQSWDTSDSVPEGNQGQKRA